MVAGALQTTDFSELDSRGTRPGMDEVGLHRVHYPIESENQVDASDRREELGR